MRETTIRVVCDRCNLPSEDFDGAIFTPAMMMSALREKGWSRRRGGRLHDAGDECPNCNRDGKKGDV